MNIATLTRAKRYAQAFLQCYGKELMRNDIKHTRQAALFLHQHKAMLILFSLPSFSSEQLLQGIKQLMTPFQLPDCFNNLYELLIERKIISLLPDIAERIVALYHVQHNIMHVAIKSSTTLSEEETRNVHNFVTKHTNKEVISSFELDPELIAGMKLQSDSILWEHSIAKSLREIDKALRQ